MVAPFESAPDLIRDFLVRRVPNRVIFPDVGKSYSGLAVVGEAPSTEEIEQGRPFVGPSGKLLMTAFDFCGVSRDDVLLDNICPVRLPEKHQLVVSEIDLLKSGLYNRLKKNKVRVVLACGLSAIRAFFSPPSALENFRGRIFKCDLGDGYIVDVIPTFHPSILLKPQGWLGFFWYVVYDLKTAFKVLNHEQPYDYIFTGKLLFSAGEVESWLRSAPQEITFDFEATEKNPFLAVPYCVSMSYSDSSGVCVPFKFVDPRAELKLSELNEMLLDLKKRIVVHNAFYDIGLIRKYDLTPPPFFDTMYQFHNIAEFMPKGLKDLGSFFCRVPTYFFNFNRINQLKDALLSGFYEWDSASENAFDKFYKYATLDAITTFRVAKVVRALADRDTRGKELYETFTNELIRELIEVSKVGLYFDLEKSSQVCSELEKEAFKLEQQIKTLLPEVKNVNSAAQLGPALKKLCNPLGVMLPTTQKGAVSTSVNVLENLAERHGIEVAKLILEYRKKKKLISTYINNFSSFVDSESRVHTTFSLAETMRLKSSEPAMQTIPRKSIIFSMFSVEKFLDRILIKVDYSTAEARTFAWFANETRLLDPTLDIHKRVASFFFKVPIEEVSKEMRQSVKTIFFGKIYGSGIGLLAKQLGCSYEEAAQKDQEFFNTFPAFKTKMNEWERSVREKGFVATPFGIKRSFKLHKRLHSLFPDSRIADQFISKAVREGFNTPSQSSVAYLTNRSLIRLNKQFRTSGMRTRVVLQIHDALYFESFKSEFWDAMWLIYSIMRQPLKEGDSFFVPIDMCAGFDLLEQYDLLKFDETCEDLGEMKQKIKEKKQLVDDSGVQVIPEKIWEFLGL